MKKQTSVNKNDHGRYSLSAKMLLWFTLLMIAVLCIIGVSLYSFMRARIKEDARRQAKTTVLNAREMIDQSVSYSIQNQLQAIADRNRDIVRYFYREFKAGRLTESKAKAQVANILGAQKIGKTGYLYIIDSSGELKVHPNASLVNTVVSGWDFVNKQIARKSGYLEYDWRNPGESKPRPKCLSMSYFAPWDYIITASAYRKEFLALIDLAQFRKEVLQLKIGQTGTVHIMNSLGTLLVHGKNEGENIYDARDATGRHFVREMCRKKNGVISWLEDNPGGNAPRIKEAFFHHYPVFDLIVVGTVYRDELLAPLQQLQKRLMILLPVILLLTLPIALLVVRKFTRSLSTLQHFSIRIANKDLREIPVCGATPKKWGRRFVASSREIHQLLCAFRDVGLSIRGLVENLMTHSRQLSTQAGVFEKAAIHTESNVADHSAIVEEVSNTIESLEEAFQRTEKISSDVFTVSEQAIQKGKEGNVAVHAAQKSMETILQTTDAARNQMTTLDDLSNQIEQVVRALEQIADSSQMLAINASIEAAEAGEAGKGFAVVATEVQDLAIQSAKATQNIRTFLQQIADTAGKAILMTEDSQHAVTDGQQSLKRMEKVIASLTHVLDSNNQHADQISKTVSEQSSAISQISNAVGHVLASSQTGNQNMVELLQAVSELNRIRLDFEKLASEFQL